MTMNTEQIKPNTSVLLDIYERAARIHKNDEAFHSVMQSGKLGIRVYYSPRGHEIIPSAICNLLTDEDYIVNIATFGDGASNIGAFHESLNMASLWKFPVIFVCQNNLIAEHTRYEKGTAVERIADRAASYNMPGLHVNGNDPVAMWNAAKMETREAVQQLAEEGIQLELIDLRTVALFDLPTVLNSIAKTKRAVIVHEAVRTVPG